MSRTVTDSSVDISISAWIRASTGFLVSRHARRAMCRKMSGPRTVPGDFFGLCVASGPDPATDDYLIERLQELNIRDIRLDYSLPDPAPYETRFLNRLLDEKFSVCLHPVNGSGTAAAADGSAFLAALERLLETTANRLAVLELGSTVNRRKWYGGTLSGFLAEYVRAFDAAAACGVPVAAPNVTDFEPVYNAVLLAALGRLGRLPRYHSNNLFVERAGEPEQFDHKILGRWMAPYLRFDLLRKARLLQAIGKWAGVDQTISSHVAWSLRRIARFSGDIEEKQADYLSRYCVLAAAGGALRRIYWGPLIGQREGLIDDGSDYYPDAIPHVTRYVRIPDNPAQYRERPALAAFKTVAAHIQGAVFAGSRMHDHGLFILEFNRPQGPIHIIWTRDGKRALVSDIFSADQLRRVAVTDRDGQRLPNPPVTVSESPTYWVWPREQGAQPSQTAKIISGTVFQGNFSDDYHRLASSGWSGIAVLPTAGPKPPPLLTAPETLTPPAESDGYMRNARNRVWLQNLPWEPDRRVVVKCFGIPRGLRRILQSMKPTRALRSWNASVEILRRGLPTPAPVAFLERRDTAALRESYFICDAIETRYSVRSFFSAYQEGAPAPTGLTQTVFFGRLAEFLAVMHRKGVFFRDLSAGNILVLIPAEGTGQPPAASFSLIDTARARFFPTPLDQRRRLCDLMRICHPLDTALRRSFLSEYLKAANLPEQRWMELPFLYYNAKHRIKKRLKRWRASG